MKTFIKWMVKNVLYAALMGIGLAGAYCWFTELKDNINNY